MNEPMKDGVYIVQDGKTTKLEPQKHGHDTIYWKNGQVLDVERAHRIRVKESK